MEHPHSPPSPARRLGVRILAVLASMIALPVVGAPVVPAVHADGAEIVVSKTTGLDPNGETITITGTGYTTTGNLSTRLPVTAGQPAGVYVIFGRFDTVWQPSAGAPSSSRRVIDQRWAVPEPSFTQVSTQFPNPQYVLMNASGEFTVTLQAKIDDTKTGNYGIYTYAGGGSPPNAAEERFVPVSFGFEQTESLPPARILDTRPDGSTVDDDFEGDGIRSAGEVLELKVSGRGNVPEDAVGVLLNVTAASAAGGGYVSVYPCGTPPNASNLNYSARGDSANLVVAQLTDEGTVCLVTGGQPTHLIADVNGYVPASSYIHNLAPARILDTRPDGSTVDDDFEGDGIRSAGEVLTLKVTGRGNVPVGASAVLLNVTAASATGGGYVSVYPCGTPPNASNLNYSASGDSANLVIAQITAAGTVCLVTGGQATHVIADVNGYLSASDVFASLAPARILDTRPDGSTVDDDFEGDGIRSAGQVLELKVAGRGNVPEDAVAVLLNVTAASAAGGGYVSVYPCGTPPNASNLNYAAGGDSANLVIAELTDDGTVCLVTGGQPTHVIADVNGYLG